MEENIRPSIELHNRGVVYKYPTLSQALSMAARMKATGRIHIGGEDGHEPQVIELRNGKRPGIKKGSWVNL